MGPRLRARLWVLAYEAFYSGRLRPVTESRLLMRATQWLQDGLTYDQANDEWCGGPAEPV